MTNYELDRLAKRVAEEILHKVREDKQLLDIMFPPKYMNIIQASEFTTIPIATLYAKINEVPHSKVGKKLIFSDRALTKWIERKNVEDEL